MITLLMSLLLQFQIPEPTGFVNDFAGVIDPASRQAMLAVIAEVREKSRGEIVVVTLSDLGGHAAIEVARDIGREWGVGATGEAGDRSRNAGVVLLLVPGERLGDGRSQLAIATGRGSEGFVTDLSAGRIRDAIGRAAVDNNSYGAGLTAGVWLLAQAYADEFQFELTGAAPVQVVPQQRSRSRGVRLIPLLVFLFIVFVLGRGGRRGPGGRYRSGGRGMDWLLLGMLLGGGGRGFGGGGASGSF